jgi:molybdopterin/thiamine biosynthesis adenylyltransferase/rhodanese-related sulfurtransferase
MGKEQRIKELRASIPELTPTEAHERQRKGAVLIDVREPDEVAAGSPSDAQRIVRGFLELRVEDVVPDKSTPVLVMCAGGVRSLFASEGLLQLGYSDVSSVVGGFTRWKSDQLPVEVPAMLDAAGRERYQRHISMPEIGEEGQLRLAASRVLMIGAGGLGCPGAFYLAAAGVGHLGIVDDDVVDRSNLQRQILHTDDRVGTSKVQSARKTLLGLNPAIDVECFETRLTSSNVEQIFEGWDIVVDGSDNFPTRYLVNDACVRLKLPNVHGSIYRFEGQVSVFWPACPERRGPCYRCLYPQPPPPDMAPSCAEAGVLGVLPGAIGTLQAIETIKILLGIGDPLVGRLIQYDALRQRFTELNLRPDPGCEYCAEGAEFPGYIDYEQFCTQPPTTAPGG